MARDENDTLHRQWRALLVDADLNTGNAEATLQSLLTAYADPSRHYHNLDHILACFGEWEAVANECDDLRPDDPSAIEAAIWYHDAIYDPRRFDNEVASADLAVRSLAALGAAPAWLDRVRDLILATQHDTTPHDPDAALVTDIDLAILAAPPDAFEAYERAIRNEYAHVADADFARGRARVLAHFINRPHLFSTACFQRRYEAKARESLCRALTRWNERATTINRPMPS